VTVALAFLVLPANASALCDGSAATVPGATSGPDTLTGTAGDDVIEGLGGNDTINGLGGNDTICGDDGDDTIDGGFGSDHLEGGDLGETSGDTVTWASLPTSGSPQVNNQTVNLATGTATTSIFTPPSTFTSDTDTVTGFENATGTNSFDQFTGDAGPNVFTGLNSPDSYTGGPGDDTFVDDTDSTGLQDAARYQASSAGIQATLQTGTSPGTVVTTDLGTDTLYGIQEIDGSSFDDQMTGNSTDNSFYGFDGNDSFEPLQGTDYVDGGPGTDTTTFANEPGPVSVDMTDNTPPNTVTPSSSGESTFGMENLIGTSSGDTFIGNGADNVFDGGDGDDNLTGGGGSDSASFASLPEAVTASLSGGTATGQGSDTLSGFENLIGSDQNDTLAGDGNANVIDGRAGNDGLDGAGGTDTASFSGLSTAVVANLATGMATGQGSDTLANFENLAGSPQNGDLLIGDAGSNTLDGGGGADTAGFSGVSQAVTATLTAGDGTATGQGSDVLTDIANLAGSDQNDTLTGDANPNVIDGGLGNDTLDGSGGLDTASFAGTAASVNANLADGTATGQGSDTLANFENLTGSPQGADVLVGDAGSNVLDGGGGAGDTAAFDGVSQGVSATLFAGVGTSTGQGTDVLSNFANLTGSDQADTLTGDATSNVLTGLAGDDQLTGRDGADDLLLGPGADTVNTVDGVVDSIDCTGGGPDSGSVDGPAPAETYIACDSDGDSVVDFLDACPTTSGSGSDGCVPAVITPPAPQPAPSTPAPKKKKCKKSKKKKSAGVAKKKCKKKKKKH
jgi:Ca2+-binding RTX toxin-like protein